MHLMLHSVAGGLYMVNEFHRDEVRVGQDGGLGITEQRDVPFSKIGKRGRRGLEWLSAEKVHVHRGPDVVSGGHPQRVCAPKNHLIHWKDVQSRGHQRDEVRQQRGQHRVTKKIPVLFRWFWYDLAVTTGP